MVLRPLLSFGGVTMFPLRVLALVGTVSEGVLVGILLVEWLASRRTICLLHIVPALLSLASTMMRALVLIR